VGQREGGSWGYWLDSQRQALRLPPSLVSRPPSRAFRFERFEARCLEARVQLDLTLPLRRPCENVGWVRNLMD
jgi:hypothetical protein